MPNLLFGSILHVSPVYIWRMCTSFRRISSSEGIIWRKVPPQKIYPFGSCKVHQNMLHLEKTVVVAYTDLGAAGSRALLSLNEENATCSSFTVESFDDIKPASLLSDLSHGKDARSQPFQVLTSSSKQVSCVIVNALLLGNKCHLVANYIMDLCTQSAVERLIILSALHLDDSRFGSRPIYENCLASSSALTTHTSLPETTPVADPFLCTLLQMVKVENIPTNLFIVPGYRTKEGRADNNTLQVIQQFHEILGKTCGLRFDIEISRNLVYKGSNDADGDLASMIYM